MKHFQAHLLPYVARNHPVTAGWYVFTRVDDFKQILTR